MLYRRRLGEKGGERPLLPKLSFLLVCILADLVYDARPPIAGRTAIWNPRIQRPYPGGIEVGMDLGRVRKAQ
jgi:hypothetical protein